MQSSPTIFVVVGRRSFLTDVARPLLGATVDIVQPFFRYLHTERRKV